MTMSGLVRVSCFALLGGAGLVGCATSGQSVDEDGLPDASVGADASDARADVSGEDAPKPVDSGSDAKADAGDAGTPVAAIYVSRTGRDSAAGDRPATPVATIAHGMELAVKCAGKPCLVRVSEGTYDAALTLVSGVNLEGGWDATFAARDPALHPTTVTSNATRTVVAKGLAAPTRVDGFTIVGATLTGGGGVTSQAVWVGASGGSLTIAHSTIRGGQGSDGNSGADGELLNCIARGGQGGVASDCGASTGGNGDAWADPIKGGLGGPGGNSNCVDACPSVNSDGVSQGQTGQAGGDGDPGAAGAPATDLVGTMTNGEWRGAESTGGERGLHGTGGGGGGSGGTKRFRACFGCGTLLGGRGGDGAPGGCAGGGGGAGKPGGAAFALVVSGSVVTLDTVQVFGGTGGKGGDGGKGADGAAGGQGVGVGHGDAASQTCGLINYSSGGGGIGGVGGHGGPGGGGAGGIGGVSGAIALSDGATVTQVGAVALNLGTGGAPGLGGASSGHPGVNGNSGASFEKQTY